jgi:hypothetical protein
MTLDRGFSTLGSGAGGFAIAARRRSPSPGFLRRPLCYWSRRGGHSSPQSAQS